MTTKEMAQALCDGLLAGLYSVEDIVNWADTIISREDNPSETIIELSLAGKRHPLDIVNLLQRVEGEGNSERAQNYLFGSIFCKLRDRILTEAQAAYALNHLHNFCGDNHWTDLVGNAKGSLDNLEEIRRQMLEHLQIFEPFADERK